MSALSGCVVWRRIARWLSIGVAGVVLAGVCLFAYFYWVSGPDIEISPMTSAGVEIATRFLGEYHLGLSRVLVSTKSGETVVDLRSGDARIPSAFRSSPGTNRLESLGQDGTRSTFGPFDLEAGRTYSIEVCGNNGFGHIRCSSEHFAL